MVDAKAQAAYALLVLVPSLPLAFSWLHFFRNIGPKKYGLLTVKLPLFVKTGSCLLFFLKLMHDDRVSRDIHDRAPPLLLLQVAVPAAMLVLALRGEQPLRWKLAVSAAVVAVWFLFAFITFSALAAGRWWFDVSSPLAVRLSETEKIVATGCTESDHPPHRRPRDDAFRFCSAVSEK